MNIYINGAQALSPQDTFRSALFPENPETFDSIMKFRPTDFKSFFNPLQRRRMTKLVQAISVCAAAAVEESGIETPDAIVVASSLGSVEESEKFLNKMITEKQEFLTPTNFVQSNHNSLGSQLALNYSCHGYNVVYSHKSLSFESALLDAFLLLSDQEARQVLVGGIDEITEENYELKKRIGRWKQEPFTNRDMLLSNTSGSIPGEGVTFFVLSPEKTSASYAQLIGVSFFPFSDQVSEVQAKATEFLAGNKLAPGEIDLVLTGNNGDLESDTFTKQMLEAAFPDAMQGMYKHLCGEYDTASSFGLWCATRILKEGRIPGHALLNQVVRPIRKMLIYHHDGFSCHSFILLQNPDMEDQGSKKPGQSD